MSRGNISGRAGLWRRMAEERVAQNDAPSGDPLDPAQMAKVLHELMVHQVELELQNEELMEARGELEANANLLTELYDFAPVGYLSLSSAGLVRQINFAGASMLGKDRALVLGKNFADFVIPEKRRYFASFLSRIFASEETQPCELTLMRPGQPEVIACLTGALSSNGLFCRVAATDITEQRRTEAAVREKNEDLDRIFDLSHDLLAIAGNGGRFRRVNPAFERVLGHSREALMACNFIRFVHPDDREASLRAHASMNAGTDVMDFVNRYRCADGSYRWLEWRAKPYGDGLICAVARDITERKQAADALRETEEKFRNIVESSPTAIYLYQLQDDGRLVLKEANPAAGKELGVDQGGLIGLTLEEAFPNLVGTEVPELFRAVARGELETRQFEIGYEGGGISGVFDVHVFRTHPGTIAVAFSDISERRMAQTELERRVSERTAELRESKRELRALADELTHAEQRERKKIASLIHEDLQQMLVAALLNLGMLKSRVTGTEALREFTRIEEMLRDSVKTARSLTAELSPPVLRQCGLAAALGWLRTWCGDKYGLDVRLDIRDDARPSEEAGITAFRCVRELLFNIVKHAGVHTADLRMWRAEGDILKIEISDAGSGFDPDEVRTREGIAGGYGLFGIRKRLEWLGGGLEIDSSPGSGSRFTLGLPLSSSAPSDDSRG